MKNLVRVLAVMLAAGLALSACAGQKKEKYDMAGMPKAAFLTEPHPPADLVAHDASACGELGPIQGDAYQALEVLVAAGNRRTGSQAYRCAAEAARNAFAARGWDTEFLNYLFPYYPIPADGFSVVRVADGKTFPSFPVMYSLPTTDLPAGRLTARVVTQDQAVKGRIVYLKEGLFFSDLKQTVKKLAQRGAVGFIVDADMSPLYSKGLPYAVGAHPVSWHYNPIPGLVAANAGELIGQEVSITNHARIVPGQGWDVIAKSPGDYQDYVLVSGHLDSWFQGALDDGSGSAVVIELSRLLAPKVTGQTGVILLLADGEEIGEYGSAAFARQFGLEKIKAMVELDMVSRKNDYSKKGPARAKILPRFVVPSSEMKPLVKQALATAPGKNHVIGLSLWRHVFGSLPMDLEWFYAGGTPGVFVWTPSKYYHTEKDTLEYMDAGDLEAFAQTVAGLVEKLQAAPLSRPVPEHLNFSFAARVTPEGKIAFELEAPKKSGRVRAKVNVFYEDGWEKAVHLQRDQTGVWRGEYSPPYTGAYQGLASVRAGRKFGRQWLTLEASARPEAGKPQRKE